MDGWKEARTDGRTHGRKDGRRDGVFSEEGFDHVALFAWKAAGITGQHHAKAALIDNRKYEDVS